MHLDASTLEDGTVIEGDICIVGAGAAGISMALEWRNTPYKVILLEGGGFNVEGDIQDLYHGESIGQRYFPLQACRLHFFGGTTGHWGGWCAPMDPIDFEKRSWIPHSGWPIRYEDLAPFYPRAQQAVEIGPGPFEVDYWQKQHPELEALPLDASKVWTKMWQFSPPTRFGTRYRNDIVEARNIHLYTYANVCDIEANASVSKVDRLHVRCLNGKAHTVRARHFVLATGAIQNARLLLAANQQAPAGLGNDHDLVGRYFMEHLEVRSAYLLMPAPGPMHLYLHDIFVDPASGELAIAAEQQREHGILNCTASMRPRTSTEGTSSMIDRFPDTGEGSIKWMTDMEKALKSGDRKPTDPSLYREFTLQSRSEQAPNPDSRITLAEERDALGMPRATLDWQLTELDKRSIRTTYEIIGREMGRTGLGRIQLMDWLLEDKPLWPSFLGGGWHHMGTTRMHDDPRQGVVDADCKVHGLANLHIAGSAAFTTAGAANPTLTLIALTLRLSDHLKDQM